MEIQENVSLRGKTTMRIGGIARFFVELKTKEDVNAAWKFSQEKYIPLIVLGGGSNTIFADGTIEALVVRLSANDSTIDGNTVTVESGKNLPSLINELAKESLDLSPLTGILGTVGGAVFGNAGQGPTGKWMDSYVKSVTVFIDGEWKEFSQEDCKFEYRESVFKDMESPPIIWNTVLEVPSGSQEEIRKEIERLLKVRIDTQPHIKTAGSCFKAVGDIPAWKLIDAANLRGEKSGNVHVAEKHANFLINDGDATFEDAVSIVNKVKEDVKEPLSVEMRFVQEDGSLKF